MRQSFFCRVLLIALVFTLSQQNPCFSYALLSHEAIIDATWEKSIQPLLKQKFPHATEEQLKEAHSYVYGGAIVADIGYYPFGSLLFTNLVHYVRAGDFVKASLQEAGNLNEYA